MSTRLLVPSERPDRELSDRRRPPGGRRPSPVPWLMVGAAVVFNYWSLRAEAAPVAYLNDSSVHEQMVRFATDRIRAGHLPQTGWFPYLGLGSPQFLHYQSLGATVTGLAGVLLGPDRAFTWSLFLCLSLWPVSVYVGARAFRLGRWTAATAALVSPLLMSHTGIGFETTAYIWTGYGVWAQLWAMLTLPLAWGFGWQAIAEGRRYSLAILFVSLTVMFHFETGYLALAPLAIFPFLEWSRLRSRIGRAAIVAGGALVATAWVTVPLVVDARWASVNEILRGTPLENGYGAKQVIEWLVTGQLLDAGRLPVLTLLAGVGLVVCCVRSPRDERSRAVLALLAMSLILSFGRTTFGPLVDVIPGSTDIFMRRFMMGIQLSALLAVGIGATAICALVVREVRRHRREPTSVASGPWVRRSAVGAAVLIVVVVALSPAWSQVASRDADNARAVAAQRAADLEEGARIAPLVERIRRSGGGRVYAGLPNNWGSTFTVGAVPVFKYLESQDVDEVGYTLRTASLMTDPEYFFDEANAGDYTLFGVRYLIVPAGRRPPVPARLVMVRRPYALWELPGVGYFHLAQAVGTVTADRADVGVRSVPYLRSSLPGRGEALVVDFAGSRPAVRLPTSASRPGPGGSVLGEDVALAQGSATAVVRADRRSLVVLSASFDPGWRAEVDGRPAPTVMVAPALVAVQVGPGTHRVDFSYVGFGSYTPLFIVCAAVLVGSFVLERWLRTRRRSRPSS